MPEVNWDFDLAYSVEGTLLLRTTERIRALELPSIDPNRIQVRKLPWVSDENDLAPPYVLVTPAPETTSQDDGTNEQDETVFAVMIAVVLANGRDASIKGMGLQLFWRERIRRAFVNKSARTWADLQTALTTVNGSNFFLRSWIESGDKFMEAAKREQRDAQYYVVRVQVREPRE